MTTAGVTPEVAFTTIAASELWSGARRMDAETYLSGGYGLRLQIERHWDWRKFSAFAEVWMPGRLTAVAVGREHGAPFLTATQAFDTRPIARKFLARSRVPHPETYATQEGWVLVTRSGSVGDSIATYKPHLGVIMSDDLLRVIPTDPRHRGFLYGFLRSGFGKSMLRSNQYGSIVKHLEPEHLRQVPVPVIDDELFEKCESRTARIVDLRDQAFSLTARAEASYASAIGLDQGTRGTEVFEGRASAMWSGRRRIDAFASHPEAMRVADAVQARGSQPLADLTERIFGVPRFKHIYSDHGVPYLDSEDLFKINPELTKFIPTVSARAQRTYFVERNWLLMACSGQLYGLNGSTVLATRWHENKIVSNHVNRIVPTGSIRPGYLQMALGHPTLGRPLVLRLGFGSEVPEIAAEDLRAVPVARLGGATEDAIADDVEEAAKLRQQADDEEDALATEVEKTIRNGIAADALAS